MTHEQLIVAQAEAFTILRDLMHYTADDPRPARVINTIKQAALAILRLKPLSPEEEGRSTRQRESGEGGQPSSGEREAPITDPAANAAASVDSLPDEIFTQFITRLPHNTLHPRTDKQRDRLARHFANFNLEYSDEVKAAIVNRASRRSSRSAALPSIAPSRQAA